MPKTFYRAIQRINRVKPVTDQATVQAASAECSTPPAIKRQNGRPEDSRAFCDKNQSSQCSEPEHRISWKKEKVNYGKQEP